MEMSNSEPSTSSSLTSTKQTINEMEDSQIEKKFKEDSESENESQVEDENPDQSFIENLPTEMLMKILKYLDIKSLSGCRIMNRRWNEIAREILKSRDDMETVFNCGYPWNGKLRFGGKTPKATLENFIICFDDSKEITPLFTRFRFNDITARVFDYVEWTKFVSDFGKSIKCLKLSVEDDNEGVFDMHQFAEKLRHLLWNQLPNLQAFGLKFPPRTNPRSFEFQLFPRATTKGGTTFQLPHLKVLHLDEFFLTEYKEVTRDLLRVAVNLQKIELFEHSSLFQFESFHLLQSLGKLGCLQDADIHLNGDFLSKTKENSKTPLKLKLKRLTLDVEDVYHNNIDLWPEASVFISNLFESNKDTLIKLTTNPLGFLKNLQLSTFSKLTSLRCHGDEWQVKESLFSSGINLMEIFPVLQSLELSMLSASLSTLFSEENYGVVCIPTLENLCFLDNEINKQIDKTMIAQISVMFPNLNKFQILRDDYDLLYDDASMHNFPQVGRAIWTHLKKLRYLKLYVLADGPENIFPAFDSCITGFSESYCKSLCHLLVADKLWRKCGARRKVSQSEMNAERKYPSILDLKELKHFELEVLYRYPEDELEPDSTRIGPTWISNDCAFKLMYNATFQVKKRVRHFNPGLDYI